MSGLYTVAAGLALFLPVLGQVSGEPAAPAANSPAITSPAASSPVYSAYPAPLLNPQSPVRSPAQCSAPGSVTHTFDEALDKALEKTARHSEPPAEQVQSQVSATNPLEAFYSLLTANQHRIERRLTIRITPLRQSNRNNLLAQLPRRGIAQAFEEREMEGCIEVGGIAGVQTSTGNRLLLFLRDRRIISLNLERGCEARDFYSGFYVERSEDGRLCVKRDKLQSRSGAKCEVERMRHLVKAEE